MLRRKSPKRVAFSGIDRYCLLGRLPSLLPTKARPRWIRGAPPQRGAGTRRGSAADVRGPARNQISRAWLIAWRGRGLCSSPVASLVPTPSMGCCPRHRGRMSDDYPRCSRLSPTSRKHAKADIPAAMPSSCPIGSFPPSTTCRFCAFTFFSGSTANGTCSPEAVRRETSGY